MDQGGMRIGEVLKLQAKDVKGRRLNIVGPKSGRQLEVAFILRKVIDRLKHFIESSGYEQDDRIFPFHYSAARNVVKKAGHLVGIELRAHDLRRHAAAYASKTGAPLEIISKVILRHSSLSTTQRYLGKVSDAEAIRWIESIYG
jgi:integrase